MYIRVTFVFPKDYPQATYPDGTATLELERNPLISMKDRAFMLRRLRTICEQKRPCLEACLRFLLFADEQEEEGECVPIDLEDSDSSEGESNDQPSPTVRKGKGRDVTVALLRNNKNLSEPRTSQGTFGPNGMFEALVESIPILDNMYQESLFASFVLRHESYEMCYEDLLALPRHLQNLSMRIREYRLLRQPPPKQQHGCSNRLH